MHHLQGAFGGGIGRQLDRRHEVALVLFGQEGAGQQVQAQPQRHHERGEHGHAASAALQDAHHPSLVPVGHARHAAVERAEEAAAPVVATRARLEQRGAQRGGQGQCQQCREQDGHRHGQAELSVDRAHRAIGERHRNEHRGEHQGDADHRAGEFFHRFGGGLAWRQAFFGHDPLDAFHHHDGIVDDDADRQHHAEHGQHVDREAGREHHREGAQQGDRRDDGRDERVADVLQEQVHHREHQHHRFDEGDEHFLDRDRHERRGVERYRGLHAHRQGRLEFGHARAHCAGHLHGIGPGRQLDGRRGRWRAVLAGGPRIAFGAQLDPGHVTNDHAGAIRIGTEHDGGERLRRTQLAFHGERNGDALAR